MTARRSAREPTSSRYSCGAGEDSDLLRFLTCGSVDDGKSTLIGRLLYESKALFEDQLAALAADSRKAGTRGDDVDFALLLDGLSAEREQGITIDVAYRFFSTDRRQFIVADTPGHEQYTRNMVTGASTADLAIILVDARKGILVQTRRHSYIVALLGIRQVVLAVNKMDLVGYARSDVRGDRRRLSRIRAAPSGLPSVTAIPLSARARRQCRGRQPAHAVVSRPDADAASRVREVDEQRLQQQPFRLPVQWVNRPGCGFPRIRRHHCRRRRATRAAHSRAALGARDDRAPHRHRRWRSRRSGRRPVGDARPRR